MSVLLIFAALLLAAVPLAIPQKHGLAAALRRGQQSQVPKAEEAHAGVDSVPLLLDLLASALESGLSVQGALQVVAAVAAEDVRRELVPVATGLAMGAAWNDAWAGHEGNAKVQEIHAALTFAAVTGAVASPLLYAEARRQRREANRAAQKRAAALGVQLVVPLGLCALPAFIALGIVPVVVAMIPAL